MERNFSIVSNIPIRYKALASPIVILVLLSILVSIVMLNLMSAEDDIDVITKDLAPDVNTAALISQQLLLKRIAVKEYIRSASQSAVDSFRESESSLKKIKRQAKNDFANPERIRLLSELNALDEAYNDAFYNIVIPKMELRHKIMTTIMDVKGPEMESALTRLVELSVLEKNASLTFKASSALRAALLARIYVFKFLDSNNNELVKRVRTELNSIISELKQVDSIKNNSLWLNEANSVLKDVATYQHGFEQIVTAINERNEAINNTLDVIGPRAAKITESIRNSVFQSMAQQGEVVTESLEKTRIIAVSLWVASTILGLSFSWFVTTVMTKPIVIAKNVLTQMEENSDLTARLPIFGNDEIGQQAKSVNAFIDKLQFLVQDITKAFGVLTTATTKMSEVISDSQEQVKNQAKETTSVASAVNQLATSVDEIAQSAERASLNVKSVNSQAQSGLRVIGETVEYVNILDADLTNSADVITGLNKSSYDIASMVDVIKNIAEQTNLLALNAAIEAARAGEQGRGFAVVADEVRTLAQRTQDSTKEIEDSVALVREGADRAVVNITGNKERASLLVEKANSASTALKEITAAVSTILEVNTMIATAAEEQSVVVKEVNTSIQSIDASAGEASQNSDNLSTSSIELTQLSVKVKQQLEQFKV